MLLICHLILSAESESFCGELERAAYSFPPHASRKAFIPAGAATCIGSHSRFVTAAIPWVAEFSPEVRFLPQFPRLAGRWPAAGVEWPLLVTLKTTLTAWCNQREQFLGKILQPKLSAKAHRRLLFVQILTLLSHILTASHG